MRCGRTEWKETKTIQLKAITCLLVGSTSQGLAICASLSQSHFYSEVGVHKDNKTSSSQDVPDILTSQKLTST
jgi:hypothetical protein